MAVTNGVQQRFFDLDKSGSYKPSAWHSDSLTRVGGEFILTDSTGTKIRYYGFDNPTPLLRGQFKEVVDKAGNVTTAVYSSAATKSLNAPPPGRLEMVTRTNAAGDSETWRYSYIDSGVNAGLLKTVQLLHGSSATPDRQVEYAYWDGTTSGGNAGMLQKAEVRDGAGNVIDTSFYRYFTANTDGTSGSDSDFPGYVDGLKMVFGRESYARILAAGIDPATADDATLHTYADNFFGYDLATRRVTREVVQGSGCSCSASGGRGTYAIAYADNPNFNPSAHDHNAWERRTTVTLPDGNQEVSYTNYVGQVMLSVFKEFKDTTLVNQWRTSYQYDSEGRLLVKSEPSAVTGYNETFADLIDDPTQAGIEYLADNTGLIHTFEFGQPTEFGQSTTAATTTAAGDVDGYLKRESLKHGELGAAIPQRDYAYIERSGSTTKTYPIARSTVYRYTGASGAQDTTYAYTWQGSTNQPASTTVTRPSVSAGQNGPGVAEVASVSFDQYGHAVWTVDGDGYLTFRRYDDATGAVVEMIQDANPSLVANPPVAAPTRNASLPAALHLVTMMKVDGLGRTTKTTDANGNVTYTVYKDDNREVRTYPGWNAATKKTTGPIIVQREDRPGSYSETLTFNWSGPTGLPVDASGVPTGAESLTSAYATVQSLSRTHTNASNQVDHADSYFNLGGIAYSTVPELGVEGTNFNRTRYAYDDRGRQSSTVDANGTIYSTVYDGLGRAASVWVGTDDSGSHHDDPLGDDNNDGVADNPNNNMSRAAEYEYDLGGTGDGNLTKMVQYPGGLAAPRVSLMYYDWRDRSIATHGGLTLTNSDGDTQLTIKDNAAEDAGTPSIIGWTDYDNLGQAVVRKQYAGASTDANLNDGALAEPQPVDHKLRAESIVGYDEQGRVYRQSVYGVLHNNRNESDPTNGTIGGSLNTNVWYDLRGNVIKTLQPGGLVQKTTYDGAGRTVAAYTTDGGGDAAAGTSGNWAGAGNVVGDVVLEQREATYDAAGNVILQTGRQRFHNASGTGALGSPSGGVGARVSYVGSYYDAANRPTSMVNVGTNGGAVWTRPASAPARSDTALVTSFTYDAAGRTQDVIDPRGITAHTTYDLLGRTTATIEAYNGSSPSSSTNRTTRYTYDGLGDVLTMTADLPAGQADQVTKYEYAARNSDGLNSNSVLTGVEYPDPATGLPSPTAQREVFGVNRIGEKTKYTDRNGTSHAYEYDALGRLLKDEVITFGSGVNSTVARLTYGFDSAGRPSTFISKTASNSTINQVQRTYNGFGQLAIEYQSHSGDVNPSSTPAVAYGYSGAAQGSRRASMTYPSGRVLNYDYGASGGLNDRISRLAALTEPHTYYSGSYSFSGTLSLESYDYLGLGTVVTRTAGPIKLNYVGPTPAANAATGGGDQYGGLDRFGRVVDQHWLTSNYSGATTELDRFQYGYDRDGNRLYRDNALNAAFGETYVGSSGAGYDQLNRLTGFARGTLNASKTGLSGSASRSQAWNLDALGNWQSSTTDGATESRAHDAQNRLTGVGTATLGYSPNGEMKTDEQGQQLTYDAWGRLVGASTSSSGVYDGSSYTFDALGRRTRTTRTQYINNSCTYTSSDSYYSADWQVLEEGTPSNGCSSSTYTPKSQYVWSPVYVDALVLRDELLVTDPTPLPSGGFESPSVGTGTYAYAANPTGSAWTFTGSAGYSANGTAFTSGNPVAPEGSQVAFLQQNSTISQTITVGESNTYTVSFKGAKRGNYGGRNDFQVLVDGQVVGTYNPATTSYQSFATAAVALSAGQHTVEFRGLNTAGGDNTAFIDAVAIKPATRRLYALQDANFNVTALADASGNVVERYAYDPYGAATYLTPSWGVRAGSAYGWQYLHQGGRLDGGSGLYEFRNRSYSPTLGRWNRQDPAGYVDGAQLYQYLLSAPQSSTDSYGLNTFKGSGTMTVHIPGDLGGTKTDVTYEWTIQATCKDGKIRVGRSTITDFNVVGRVDSGGFSLLVVGVNSSVTVTADDVVGNFQECHNPDGTKDDAVDVEIIINAQWKEGMGLSFGVGPASWETPFQANLSDFSLGSTKIKLNFRCSGGEVLQR